MMMIMATIRNTCCILSHPFTGLLALSMILRAVPAVAGLTVGRHMPDSSKGRSDTNTQPAGPTGYRGFAIDWQPNQ